MNSFSLRDPQLVGALAAAGLCVGGIVAWSKMRKKPTEEELEKLRREHLVKVGRIIDGTVMDISDSSVDGGEQTEPVHLILYRYEIAGVVYECSQDVTHLKDYVNIYECRLSFPCSVRYDPHRPTNSIVIAESWSGLRNTANSVPVRMITPHKPRGTASKVQI